jgi:hypothetical protein
MAKVFADNISLTFENGQPLVLCTDHAIEDATGNGNGQLDPGEEVGLVLTLKNFGAPASNVQATLESDDPNVLIVDDAAGFGDIAEGATGANAADPFVVQVPALARTGHLVEFTVNVSHADGETASTFMACIGKLSFLVWDPTGDQSSGPVIFETLQSLGYQGGYRQSIEYTDLDFYASVFISLGIYANTYRIAYDSGEAAQIIAYLEQGGQVYLEGGDAWVYDPQNGGFDFSAAFRIVPLFDGYPNLGEIQGRQGTLTQGMQFDYDGENEYIDQIQRTGAGVVLFENENPAYACGVGYDSGVYKTIGTSFEFAGLTDGTPPSTREALAGAVMEFFLPPRDQAVPLPEGHVPLAINLSPGFPNPFGRSAAVHLELARDEEVQVAVFDATGRGVRRLLDGLVRAGAHELTWDGCDGQGRRMPAGTYYLQLDAGGAATARKLILTH